MKKQIIKNLFSNYITNFVGVALGFLLVPFLIRRLGKDAFGLIILAESTIVFFEVVAVNIRMAVARHITFSLACGKKKEFDEYLSTGQMLFFGSALLVLAVGSVLSYFFTDIFRVPPAHFFASRALFFFITLSFAASIVFMVRWSILYAKHRFDLINLSSSSGVVLRALLLFGIFSAFPQHASLVTYGAVYLMMSLTQNLSILAWQKKVLPSARASLSDFRRTKAREILSYSGYLSLNRASSLLDQNAVNIIINLFWGSAYNAVYSIATKLPMVISRFFEEPTWTLTSMFNEFVAKGDHKRLKTLYFLYTTLIAVVITPLGLFLILYAQPIIRFWVGPEFDLSGRLMPIFMLPLFFQLPLCVSGCLINSFGRVKLPCIVSLTVSTGNVILGIILGKVLGLGLFGIAISSTVCGTAYMTIFSPAYACKAAQIPLRQYLLDAFLAPLIKSIILSAAFLWLVQALLDAGHTVLCLALAPVLGAVYLLAAYAWVLDAAQRAHIKEIVNPSAGILKPRAQFSKGPKLKVEAI